MRASWRFLPALHCASLWLGIRERPIACWAGALFPNWWVMQRAWELVLPDFTFGTWGGFFVGMVESFVGGFLTAVLFVPIWNFFAAREESQSQMTPAMKLASQHHG